MLIESVEAAFHYPMDHTFVIQNFTAIQYGKVVKPSEQATVGYSFVPAEPFAGRPFGLSINIAYSSVSPLNLNEITFYASDNKSFYDHRRAAFSASLSSMKLSTLLKWMMVWMEKLSSSTSSSQLVLFYSWFWASKPWPPWVNEEVVPWGNEIEILICMNLRYSLLFSNIRVETGTTRTSGNVSDDGIDYDWLPKETLNELSTWFEVVVMIVLFLTYFSSVI